MSTNKSRSQNNFPHLSIPLPPELLEGILHYLDVDSLLVSRCVNSYFQTSVNGMLRYRQVRRLVSSAVEICRRIWGYYFPQEHSAFMLIHIIADFYWNRLACSELAQELNSQTSCTRQVLTDIDDINRALVIRTKLSQIGDDWKVKNTTSEAPQCSELLELQSLFDGLVATAKMRSTPAASWWPKGPPRAEYVAIISDCLVAMVRLMKALRFHESFIPVPLIKMDDDILEGTLVRTCLKVDRDDYAERWLVLSLERACHMKCGIRPI